MGRTRQDWASTEMIMKIMGIAHIIFGLLLIVFQALCEYISWVFENHTMFEDTFKPGFWLGPAAIILGVLCICQSRFTRPGLHVSVVLFSMVTIILFVFYIGFKAYFIVNDPESMTFDDCESPFQVKFFLDDSPHCLAQKFNDIFGQCMMAFVSADIIVCVAGLISVCCTRYAYSKVPS